ncbi:histidinol phosphate phosphatase domain-containing protein [bacterium]|nr:histidinol phosphate phosphatase domain-containing protein [bacterium]
MIDLHTHTLFSDGDLIPSELVRRAVDLGYRGIAMTDHVDASNLSFVVSHVRTAADQLNAVLNIRVLVGVELTHVPPILIPEMIQRARHAGAQIVVVHGETLVEPTAEGTNYAAIKGGADILAHPGLLSAEDAQLAAERGVLIEITTRSGHSYSNGHVAATARAAGAKLVINTDTHGPSNMLRRKDAERLARGAGLTLDEIDQCYNNAEELIARAR